METLTIDGSIGEGGGQILRTALALALCQQRPIVILRIRANRAKSGLRRQHLMAVRLATEIGRATVTGDSIGSGQLQFSPTGVYPGQYRIDIGSAGSTSLVLQTVLPVLLTAAAPSQLTLRGGTHNPMAPTVDFLQRSFIPPLTTMGPAIAVQLHRHGFFPAGGGEVSCQVKPASILSPLSLLHRGPLRSITAEALLANLPEHIGRRELKLVKEKLDLPANQCQLRQVASDGPGNALLITVSCEHITACFGAIGQLGLRAETLAGHLCKQVTDYLQSGVPVGHHLADQLLLPLLLAGSGGFVTSRPSRHTLTNLEVIQRFGMKPISVRQLSNRQWWIGFNASPGPN